jgi:nucleoside-diphosphate-sugar epimerase
MLHLLKQLFQTQPPPDRPIVLITGAAGGIGTYLRQELEPEYHVRCLDLVRVRDAQDVWVADVTNFQAVRKAMRVVEVVIHLAGNPEVQQPWADVYTSGIAGTYNVFEAARQAGVKQIIYASTNHVSGERAIAREPNITPAQSIRPDSLYAVGKAFGEALGQFFVDRYQMSIVCLRIGWFRIDPKITDPDDILLAIYCSPRDLAQMVRRSLATQNLGFQIFYAVSANTRRYWDISNAQTLLGYAPQDNAEDLLSIEGAN